MRDERVAHALGNLLLQLALPGFTSTKAQILTKVHFFRECKGLQGMVLPSPPLALSSALLPLARPVGILQRHYFLLACHYSLCSRSSGSFATSSLLPHLRQCLYFCTSKASKLRTRV